MFNVKCLKTEKSKRYIYIYVWVILSAYLHRNLEVCIRLGAPNLNDFIEWKLIKLLLLLLLLLLFFARF